MRGIHLEKVVLYNNVLTQLFTKQERQIRLDQVRIIRVTKHDEPTDKQILGSIEIHEGNPGAFG